MKKILKILLITIFIVCICGVVVFATEADITTGMKINVQGKDTGFIGKFFGMLLGVVQAISVAVILVSIVIAGAKYMLSSTNEKATIKQQALPIIIGAVIALSASTLVKMVAKFSSQAIK